MCRRYSACVCDCKEGAKIYVMYSNLEFCWLFKLKFDENNENLIFDDEPNALSVRGAILIDKINHEQMIVQTL